MEKKVRCLLLASHYRPLVGGAQAVYDALARCAGGHISVLTGSTNLATGERVAGIDAFDASAPYRIRRLAETRPAMLAAGTGFVGRLNSFLKARRIERKLWQALAEEIDETGADIVCIGALDSHGWLIGPIKRRLGLPVILFTHGEEISQTPYSARADARRRAALHAADAVIAVSRFTVGLISSKYGVPASRIHLLTNGVDYPRFAAKSAVDARAQVGLGAGPLVVGLGRLVRRKGFDRLLEAWPQVRAQVPDARLAIAGTGELAAELAAKADASVSLLGRVEDDMLPALLQAADIFAMPNRTLADGDTEGFGLVFLEAAAAGITSVAGNAGGAPDAVLDGETGLLVDGNDPAAIAAALVRLLTDDALRHRLAHAAHTHAAKQDWPHKAEAFLSICETLAHANED